MNGAYTPQHFSTQRPGGVSTARPGLNMMGSQGFVPSNPNWQPQPIPAPYIPQALLQYTPPVQASQQPVLYPGQPGYLYPNGTGNPDLGGNVT